MTNSFKLPTLPYVLALFVVTLFQKQKWALQPFPNKVYRYWLCSCEKILL